MEKYIAIDIGGTMIKYGLVGADGSLAEAEQISTEAAQGGPYVIEKVARLVQDCIRREPLAGICISTAGMVDSETGTILYANQNIPGYTGMKVKEILESRSGLPCEVENDVACAGLAEYHSGAAKNSRASVCLTIGTGIGSCILIDGKVYHGASHSAGEIGYINMFGTQFEELASSRALIKQVARQKNIAPESLSGIEIFDLAEAGDPVCIDAIARMCDMLGYGIANICYVINPDIVVIGGGIAARQNYLYPLLRKSIDHYLIDPLRVETRLSFAALGNQAGMLGAYYHFRSRHPRGDKL